LNRFEQIERLFEQASALPPRERAAFLDAGTTSDPTLRAETEEFLRASAAANANPAWEHGALLNLTPAPNPAFDGPGGFSQYRILESIGVGGMGVVYRAICTRENREQVVAIKIEPPVRRDSEIAGVLTRELNATAPWQNRDKTPRVETNWVAFERKADAPSY